jgi:L-aspartate oxidase
MSLALGSPTAAWHRATPVRIASRLAAPAPGWTTYADVIVVGSGIAGLTAALECRRHGRVLLVTKTYLEAGATPWAQGGIAAALAPEDSPADHLTDTLTAGAGLCETDAVRVLVTEGPARVRRLAALGADFERTESGELALTREGGHLRDRIAHAGGDATGREISRALVAQLDQVRADPGIEVIEHALVLDVLTDTLGRACGVTLHVIGEGTRDGVGAALGRAVVLATGGLGHIYRSSTNPPVATGDGVAAALRAGARVADLEFVQFHPTVLWQGAGAAGQLPLISEAVRGEGAVLRDAAGERFMVGRHPLADLAPRDVVSRAEVEVMREQGIDHVWLDARHLGADFLERRFPSVLAGCRARGVDPVVDLVPVAPAQHYASGGVLVDTWGRTSLPGLYACGEVSASGVHGANRLASNSLLEGLVWGHRIAQHLGGADLPQPGDPTERTTTALVPASARPRLQAAMTAGAGVTRDAAGLRATQDELAALGRADIAGAITGTDRAPSTEGWETTNLQHVAAALVQAALLREETRGGHWRADFPRRDDERWRGRLVSSRGPDGHLDVGYVPLETP